MSWNIGKFLPERLEKAFLNIIAEFIFKMSAFFKESEKMKDINEPNEEQAYHVVKAKDLITKHFSNILLGIVQEASRNREDHGFFFFFLSLFIFLLF